MATRPHDPRRAEAGALTEASAPHPDTHRARQENPMATHRHQPDQGLAELHRRLDLAGIPSPRRNNLRLATWNIRELGKSPRWDESIALLAATIGGLGARSVGGLR